MVGVVLITFALIANCYFYIRILQALWKRKRDKTLQTSEGLERSIRQASVMVVANGIVFYFCFIVFLATMSITLVSSFSLEMTNVYQVTILSDVNYTFVLINASINPLIYFITNNSYRHAFKNILWMCRRKQFTQCKQSILEFVYDNAREGIEDEFVSDAQIYCGKKFYCTNIN